MLPTPAVSSCRRVARRCCDAVQHAAVEICVSRLSQRRQSLRIQLDYLYNSLHFESLPTVQLLYTSLQLVQFLSNTWCDCSLQTVSLPAAYCWSAPSSLPSSLPSSAPSSTPSSLPSSAPSSLPSSLPLLALFTAASLSFSTWAAMLL